MRHVRSLLAVCAASLVLGSPSRAQEAVKPGQEFDLLKQMVGTWDAVAKAGGQEFKAVATSKLDLGGRWVTSELNGEIAGQKIEVKGMMTYDPDKKKYVIAWAASMSHHLMVMEGTYDERTKKMTVTGEGPGLDGKPAKHKIVGELKDKDTMVDTRSIIDKDGKEQEYMTITYKRRK